MGPKEPFNLTLFLPAGQLCYLYLNRLLGCVSSRSVIGWRLPSSNSTQITDGCGVGCVHRDIWQLLCFRCMQAIIADTVIAYITHDGRSNISSVSSRHRAKRHGGLQVSKVNSIVWQAVFWMAAKHHAPRIATSVLFDDRTLPAITLNHKQATTSRSRRVTTYRG